MKVNKAVINISPLCDCCFTVLCTLIMIVPVIMVAGQIKVTLPSAHVQEMREETALMVTVSAEGRVAIGEKEIASIEEALELLKKEIEANPERMILIRADRFVLHGIVLDFLRTAKILGAERIAVAVEQRGV